MPIDYSTILLYNSSNPTERNVIHMAENIFEENIVPLIDEDGNEVKFEIIADTEYEGHTYLALIPAEEESEEYFILKVITSEDDPDELEDLVEIEDDDEFEKVADLFDEILNA